MFNFLKKDASDKNLNFADMDGIPLKENDIVFSGRYNLGKCRILKNENGYAYQSLETGKIVSWAKMIDASSKNQKVKKQHD